jgi:hypothetical protein
MTTDESDRERCWTRPSGAVHDATEAVQTTSQSIAGAIEAGRRPGGLLDQLAKLTRQAPIHSLAIAFLLGFIVSRRR